MSSSIKFQCVDDSGNPIFLVDSATGISHKNTRNSSNSSTGALLLYGGLSINSTTNSVNVSNGGVLTVGGGASFSKDVYIGGDLRVYGTQTLGNVTLSNLTSGNILTNNINLGISNIYSGSFTSTNDQSVASNVSGLSFPNATVSSFVINLTVNITTNSNNYYETFILEGTQTNSGWSLFSTKYGDDSGIVFSITSSGQIQYTSTNISNFTNGLFNFSVNQITKTGNYSYVNTTSQGTLVADVIQILSTNDSNLGVNNGGLYLLGGATISKSLYVGTSISSSNAILTNISSNTLNISNISASIITTGTLNVNTRLSSANISASLISTGTVNAATLVSSANIAAFLITTGTVNASNLVSSANIAASLITTGTVNASTLVSSANIAASLISSGTVNATTLVSSANIATSLISSGTVNASTLVSSANIAASLITSGTVNAATLVSSANISASLISSGTVNATTLVSSANIAASLISSGTVNATTLVSSANIAASAISTGILNVSTSISSATLNLSSGLTAGTVRITGPGGIGTNGSVLITGQDSFGHSLYVASVASQKRLVFNNTGSVGNIFAYDYGSSASQNISLQGFGGNVGIGISSPTSTLSVLGGISTNFNNTIISEGLHLQWNRSGAEGESWIINQKGGGTANSGIRFGRADTSNNVTELMRILDSGNVGIATGTPESKLHVNGAITIEGESITSAQVDSSNLTQTYLHFKHNGSISDWAYLRQIGSSNNYLMALDIHDDGDEPGFCIRSITSTANPDIVNERFRVQANGNVGIGTSSPGTTLDVSGTFRATTSVTSAALFATNITATNIVGTTISAGTILGGSMGIGTTSPLAKLNVQGDASGTYASDSGQIIISGSTNSNKRLGIALDTNNNVGILQAGLSGTTTYPIALNPGGSNVGINTTSPGTTLDVSGTFRATTSVTSGALYATNVTATNIVGTTISAGTIVGTTLVSSANVSASVITAGSVRSSSIIISGSAAQVSSYPLTNGLENSFSYFNNTLASGDNTRWVVGVNVQTGVGNYGFWNSSLGRPALMMTSTGNIGIGTTSLDPNARLQVSGGSVVTNMNNVGVEIGGTGTVGYLSTTTNHPLSFAAFGPSAMIIYTSGNIGINSVSARSKLEISPSAIDYHSTKLINDYALSLTFPAATAGSLGIAFGITSVTSPSASVTPGAAILFERYSTTSLAGALHFLTKSATLNNSPNLIRMTIQTSGNIGIGTTSPSAKLELSDSTGSSNAPFIKLSGAGGAGNQVGIKLNPWSGRSGGDSSQIIAIDDGAASSHLTFYTASGDAGTSTERMRIMNSGNVGIGTNAPATALEVVANGSGIRQTYSGCSVEMYTTSTDAWVQTFTNNSLNFGAANGTHMTVNTNGNIGMGTQTPNASVKLQVLGKVGIGVSDLTDSNRGILDVKASAVDYHSTKLMSDHALTLSHATATNGSLGIAFGISNIGTITPGASIIYERIGGNNLGLLHFCTKSGTAATAASLIRMTVQTSGNVGIGTTAPTSTLQINGSLAKTSGTFDIKHPIVADKRLVHSFIEGPRCDLIYRGTATLQNGQATVNLDSDCVQEQGSAMTQGTFEALCANPVKYLHNNSSFDRVKGSISGNILTIVCENQSSTDTVDWMVVAERKDEGIKEWDRTNANGFLITEY